MKVGVWVPNCRHLATPEIIRSTAIRAEQLGYDSVWVSDHVVVPHANVVNFGETIFDPLVTLGVVAGATSRVQLGTTVLIVPYRNAVVTAKMISSLDALSGGRVVFGVGAGWVAAESAALGVPFAERGAMTDEYLRAMHELVDATREQARIGSWPWRYHSDRAISPPLSRPDTSPLQSGRLPASMRPALCILIAALGCGQARGRATAPALTLRNDARVLRAGDKAPASAHAGRVLAGEPAALLEQLAELAECGVEHLVLEFLAADGRDLDAQLTTFAERVRPRLA